MPQTPIQNPKNKVGWIWTGVILLLAIPSPQFAEGHVETHQFKSKILRKAGFPIYRKGIQVYLPEEYEDSGQEYPVVYLLHGGWWMGLSPHLFLGHGYNGQLTDANIPQIADELIRDETIPPMIIVMPDVSVSKSLSPANGISLINAYLTQEVIPFIDATYRTLSHRNGRIIAGHSDGADGAIFTALSNPNTFSAVAAYAGVGLSIQGIDPQKLVTDYKKTKLPLTFWIYVGRKDEYGNLAPTRRFVRLLEKTHLRKVYREDNGDHTRHVAQQITESLIFFSNNTL